MVLSVNVMDADVGTLMRVVSSGSSRSLARVSEKVHVSSGVKTTEISAARSILVCQRS